MDDAIPVTVQTVDTSNETPNDTLLRVVVGFPLPQLRAYPTGARADQVRALGVCGPKAVLHNPDGSVKGIKCQAFIPASLNDRFEAFRRARNLSRTHALIAVMGAGLDALDALNVAPKASKAPKPEKPSAPKSPRVRKPKAKADTTPTVDS